ncbi:MAG TPA: hypothetical protein VMM18_08015 [Gemmatimonadaceae bacterium]|nr:hypothetical protein [Gemmatimonadaceae bacterium]
MPAPAARRWACGSRARSRLLVLASILTLAPGCDKAKELAGGSGAQAAEPPASERLDLSTSPEILFQVFGERDDARMIPIAVIDGGRLKPIVLAASGWRQFDAMYGKAGTSYTLYRDGRAAGTAVVRQGMWEKPDQPLYSLPNCQVMIPLSRVRVDTRMRLGFTIEALASNASLGRRASDPTLSAAQVDQLARQVGQTAAQQGRIAAGVLAGLNLNARAIETRSAGPPVVIASFTDPKADERAASGGNTANIFAIAERGEDGSYQIAFSHVVSGSAADAEYRRFIDHLDIDGDGTDEIVLEGWDARGSSFLSVIRAANGRWSEMYRSRTHWCLDRG